MAIQSMSSGLQEPVKLPIIRQAVDKQFAITAFARANIALTEEVLQDLGPNASQGYHAIVGEKRFMFQAKGHCADTHTHNKIEITYIALGALHAWIFPPNGDRVYAFYKKGDTMTVEAGMPHAVVAASYEDQEGVVMIRSSEPNPQILGDFPPLPCI